MTEWYGWAGVILDVNLTSGDIIKKPLSRDMAVNHIGGRPQEPGTGSLLIQSSRALPGEVN